MINFALNTAFHIMGRAFAAVYVTDTKMRALATELNDSKDNVYLRMGVLGSVGELVLDINKNGISTVNARKTAPKIDLNIVFKIHSDALRVMLGRMSIVDAYVNKLFYVVGDINELIVFLEMSEMLIAYLLSEKKTAMLMGYLPERTSTRRKVYKKLVFAKKL